MTCSEFLLTIGFKEAESYVVPFGKNKGRTIGAIAETPKGLIYLDWLESKPWLGNQSSHKRVKEHLRYFMKDPGVQARLLKAREYVGSYRTW